MAVLTGKVALVTGGSRGIGAAIARRLANDGALVGLTYSGSRERAEAVVAEITAAGGTALAIQADALDAEAVEAAVAQTAESFGRLDILVNNAGVAVLAPIEEFSLEEFDRLMAVNVRSVFVASRAAARRMTEGGRIITIGSVNGDSMPFSGGSVYAASKAAVAGMTRGMARDLGPRGITVNVVQPGPVNTEMNPDSGDFANSLKSMLALSRYGKAEEVAAMVAYLTGPEAGFVTGASLTIDGGFNT